MLKRGTIRFIAISEKICQMITYFDTSKTNLAYCRQWNLSLSNLSYILR